MQIAYRLPSPGPFIIQIKTTITRQWPIQMEYRGYLKSPVDELLRYGPYQAHSITGPRVTSDLQDVAASPDNGLYSRLIQFPVVYSDMLNSITELCRSRWPPWPLGYWDRGFNSRSGHGCLSLCFYVALSCVDTGLCDGLIIRLKDSYHVSK
jgi:hypothetical protein